MRVKVVLCSLLAACGIVLAQEDTRQAAIGSIVVAGVELAEIFGQGYEAIDSEARAALVPTLSAWLEAFRDDAIERGVEPIPPELGEAFAGHLPPEVLESVRWRIEPESVLIGRNVLQAGVRAVTLDNVVLFASAEEAANAKLWAHELYHVLQYRQWGIAEFVERFLADRNAVEHDAREFRWQWMKATGRVPPA